MTYIEPLSILSAASEVKPSIDLEWLGPFVKSLKASTESNEPDLFEILTYGSSEQVNSNILAFYFDREGHHGFKDLFVQALKSAMLEAWKKRGKDMPDLSVIGTGSYTVHKEYPAASKRIDLLISGNVVDEDISDTEADTSTETATWAVIIENKLYAGLHNDLGAYWKSVKAEPDRKFGVILSLHPVPDVQLKRHVKNYVNVLHSELVQHVKHHLKDHYEDANDRHLLILKEYLRSINSHYNRDTMDVSKEADLALVQEKEPEIRELNAHVRTLKRYVMERIDKVMIEFGYEPMGNARSSQYRHYYASEAACSELKLEHGPFFRFWIPVSSPLFHDKLMVYFELYGDHTKYGDVLRSKIARHFGEEDLKELGLSLGKKGSTDGAYFHLACTDGTSLNSNGDLEEGVRRMMKESFFKGDTGLVQQCAIWMKELTSAQ